MLQALTIDPVAPIPRDDIAFAVGKKPGSYGDRSIDTLMARLRRRVSISTGECLPIRAVHSVGYVFAAPEDHRAKADT